MLREPVVIENSKPISETYKDSKRYNLYQINLKKNNYYQTNRIRKNNYYQTNNNTKYENHIEDKKKKSFISLILFPITWFGGLFFHSLKKMIKWNNSFFHSLSVMCKNQKAEYNFKQRLLNYYDEHKRQQYDEVL